ncbi:hypothetical protein H6F44_20920 [Pseudanabaena sp. FACHB-1277]|uniref:Uncharacterized protein n=1 Tax=Pseudanabaena cinerea FACHB-1277 TaxID=2949581 RepID=A0A926UYY5_9CYAN|nr:hypothetical protein [Pseudanabaena cinerea]MBD2152562.1 hypothetical protein [Pseudanabaena cinerea FACHB-1277]
MDNNRIDTNPTIVTGWTDDGNLKITIETRRSISGDAGLETDLSEEFFYLSFFKVESETEIGDLTGIYDFKDAYIKIHPSKSETDAFKIIEEEIAREYDSSVARKFKKLVGIW